jgi:hypothetical protein
VVGNDSISSIFVPNNMRLEVWEDAGFKGASRDFRGPVDDLSGFEYQNHRYGWNDRISSLKVYAW